MSYKNPRVNDLNMSTLDVVKVMAGGNPGALTVCLKMLTETKQIDPQESMEGLSPILLMDTLDIHEEKIWMLYKNVCNQNMSKMLAILRAYQLGQLEGCTEQAIHHAIQNGGQGLNVDKICEAVQKRLPQFKITS